MAQNNSEMQAQLLQGEHLIKQAMSKPPGVVFLFKGQDDQDIELDKQLYETQPIFKESLDSCAKILNEPGEVLLTHNSKAALFAYEYALVQLWKSWVFFPMRSWVKISVN